MRNPDNYVSYNTLDIDTTDREILLRIMDKVFSCPFISDVKVEPSRRKGYHFRIWCSVKCDMCRLIFDDEIRYHYDQTRPEYEQNLLGNETETFIIDLRGYKYGK